MSAWLGREESTRRAVGVIDVSAAEADVAGDPVLAAQQHRVDQSASVEDANLRARRAAAQALLIVDERLGEPTDPRTRRLALDGDPGEEAVVSPEPVPAAGREPSRPSSP